MTELTRRTVLAGAGAVSAAGALAPLATSPATAAASAAGKQNAGFYRYNVGDIEVTVATDGARSFKLPDKFVVNRTKDEVNKALEAAYMPRDMMTIYFSPILLKAGGKLVLIDTGYGEAMYEKSKGGAGQLKSNLAAAGVKRDDISTVIISHYHQDHVDGLLTADGRPAYPNAEILVPAKEHAFWMDDGEMSRAPKGRMEGLFKNNRRVFVEGLKKKVSTYEWGKELAPGVTAIGTPGHTPGHTSFVLASGKDKVFVQSDVTNVPWLFVRNPRWHAVFDQDPAEAEKTRLQTYDMVVAEKLLMQAYHYPFPAAGHIEKDGDGYRVIPVQWTPSL
jgi:glyoxylase-like metal-dependent hydrolase (beta-lactamase superfamily II)